MISGFLIAVVAAMISGCKVHPVNNDREPGKTIALRLEPGENNPRNSEGDFIELKDGRILFVYSHYFAGRGGDHDPAYLAGRYSSDGGKTWTSEDVKIVDREGTMNVMSVSLLRLKSGEMFVGLKFFHVNPSFSE